jgi:regulator of sigma E protease
LKLSYMMFSALLTMLWKLITFKNVSMEVAGPIGIAQATGQAVKYGYIAVLQLTGLLSLNLAIVNILPIPALDGGRLLFVFLEKILGRKVKPKAERIAHQIGMVFLLLMIILVTVNDIVRLIKG